MAYVSPYLLLPRRNLPTACRQIHQAKGILAAPCGACSLSDMCKSPEAKALALLPKPIKKDIRHTIASTLEHQEAA